jgi:predicted RNA-binding protein with PIN domain
VTSPEPASPSGEPAAAGLTGLPEPLLEGYLEAALQVVRGGNPARLPGALRGFATWAPRKLRSPRVVAMVKRALETDQDFRGAVDATVLDSEPALAELLRGGRHDDALASGESPEAVARVGIALGPAGAAAVKAAVDRAEVDAAQAQAARMEAATAEVSAELAAARKRADDEAAAARSAREHARGLNEELRRAERERRKLELRVQQLEQELRDHRAEADSARSAAAAERRRLRAKLAETRGLLEETQRANRALRRASGVDPAVAEAVAALERDLRALRRAARLDTTPLAGASPAPSPPDRREPLPVPGGRTADDPETLKTWAAAPGVMVLVDGYNVTKHPQGFPDHSLEDQRTVLLVRCRALVRRGTEIVVVFDGAEVGPVPTARVAVNGVKVVFTDADRTADDEIIARVNAAPPQQHVVVVSSDNEVRTRAAKLGANVVRAPALLALDAR